MALAHRPDRDVALRAATLAEAPQDCVAHHACNRVLRMYMLAWQLAGSTDIYRFARVGLNSWSHIARMTLQGHHARGHVEQGVCSREVFQLKSNEIKCDAHTPGRSHGFLHQGLPHSRWL